SVVGRGGLRVFCVFFFSSRRRHTRFSRDWSSDVCSSDLHWYACTYHRAHRFHYFSPTQGDTLPAAPATHGTGPAKTAAECLHPRSEERRVGKECRAWGGRDE